MISRSISSMNVRVISITGQNGTTVFVETVMCPLMKRGYWGTCHDFGYQTDFFSCRCTWCEMVYNISYFNDIAENKEGCSSVGVSVAPIPASILSVESYYNQTYTGGYTFSEADSTISAVSTTRHVSNPGIPNILTLNGGGQPSTRTTPTSTQGFGPLPSATTSSTATVGSSTGGAEGQNIGVALVFSFVAFGLSVLNLI